MTEGWGSALSRLEIHRASRPMGVRIPRPPPLTSREASLLPGSLTVGAVVRTVPILLEVPLELIEHSCRTGMLAENRQDRKSTRLNSSHSQISYAVFCLKKKQITLTEEANNIYL